MEMLIGLAMSAALLYFWLLGHWFARVLVFLGLAGVSGFAGLIVGSTNSNAGAGVTIGLLGLGAAWVVAALPTFYWRRRIVAEYGADALV